MLVKVINFFATNITLFLWLTAIIIIVGIINIVITIILIIAIMLTKLVIYKVLDIGNITIVIYHD